MGLWSSHRAEAYTLPLHPNLQKGKFVHGYTQYRHQWAYGLVGFTCGSKLQCAKNDVALTQRRSPVRMPVGNTPTGKKFRLSPLIFIFVLIRGLSLGHE